MRKLERAINILNRLNASSYEAFIVGGAVRDYLLHLDLTDIDITTNAKPEEIAQVFKKTIPTGQAFGTMTVIEEGDAFEITTYRQDGSYLNHRKPASVKYADDVYEDLKRRDFTINQLRMDASRNIYDDFNGLEDLQSKIIRTIGNPEERFEEDALRLLRAFRFSAKLGFTIEENTLKAIQKKAYLIQKISIERIQNELSRMLEYENVLKTVHVMIESGFAYHLFHLKNALMHLLAYAEGSKWKRLYLISQKTDLSQLPWKLPSKTLRRLQTIKSLDEKLQKTFYPRLILECEEADFKILDEIAIDENKPSIITTYHELKIDLIIPSKKDLMLNGKELDDALVLKDKSQIQPLLDALIDEVLAGRVINQKDALINYAKLMKK